MGGNGSLGKKKAKKSDSQQPSFEESLAQLEETVQQLEAGQLGLSESLELYERGIKTLKDCHEALSAAERRIELVTGVDAAGNPETESFDEGDLTLEEKRSKRSRRRSGTKAAESAENGGSAEDDGDVDVSGSLF